MNPASERQIRPGFAMFAALMVEIDRLSAVIWWKNQNGLIIMKSTGDRENIERSIHHGEGNG